MNLETTLEPAIVATAYAVAATALAVAGLGIAYAARILRKWLRSEE